jgi:hypothetical protein
VLLGGDYPRLDHGSSCSRLLRLPGMANWN